MKLVTFERNATHSFGVLTDAGILDLGLHFGGRVTSLADLVVKNALAEAREIAAARAVDHALTDVTLDKPLLTFGKCFCVGVNYPDRNAEYKDQSDAPKYPSLFIRFPESFVGPEQPILRPPESTQLDYEGEVVLVIGKRGRRIPRDAWAQHVFGYTIANEGTLRDFVRHGKFNVTPGKNFASSGSLGPWIVPAFAAPAGPFRIVTRVNGEERQNDTTDRMTFSFGVILEYISTFCTLEPGDIILTGTPTGAGARFDPPRWLKPGDDLQVEVAGLGLLRNAIADEPQTS